MKVGTNDVKRLFLGNSFVKEACLGTDEVYNIYNDPVSAEFVYRPTANGTVANPMLPQYGKAKITDIKGKTIAWNQLVQNGDFADDSIWAPTSSTYTSFSVSSGVGIVTALTNSGNISAGLKQTLQTPLVSGHKYAYSLTFKTSFTGRSVVLSAKSPDKQLFNESAPGNVWTTKNGIFTASGNSTIITFYMSFGDVLNVGETASLKNFVIFDLTLMFGSGNEPTTVADFESLYPNPYYAYLAGKLKNNDALAVVTTGFNQWDEVWRTGYLDTDGTINNSESRICPDNYIPVIAGQTYYCNKSIYYCVYDADKNMIGSRAYSSGATFTIPAGGCYLRFMTDSDYTGTYNNDICVNLSWSGYRDGEYEPYWKSTLQLNLNNIACHDENNNPVTVNGLDGVGSAYDEGVVENGMLTKIIRRFAEVDLGDFSYTYISDETGRFDSTSVPRIKSNTTNGISSKYPVSAWEDHGSKNKVIMFDTTLLRIKDSSYSSVDLNDGHASWLEGVKLRYELATPLTFNLVTPIPVEYNMDYFGTERILPENTTTPTTTPFKGTISYPK